jgi:hypothetical protein
MFTNNVRLRGGQSSGRESNNDVASVAYATRMRLSYIPRLDPYLPKSYTRRWKIVMESSSRARNSMMCLVGNFFIYQSLTKRSQEAIGVVIEGPGTLKLVLTLSV